jgi:aspartate/methionine/tyrosine aminotransferase
MRDAIAHLPASRIREVANAGIGRSDVLAFWFGESDEVTPQSVRDAAAESLARGETFYAHNLGLPELREALAAYASALHGSVSMQRIAVTSSGVSALMLATEMLVGAGDEVVAVVPVWPNLTAQPVIMGAKVVRVPLVVRDGAWVLDLQRLLDAVTPATRMLVVNAPNNPTGWALTRAEQHAILEHCRKTGTWIVADEVYERLWYGEEATVAGPPQDGRAPPRGARAEGELGAHGCAPSFLDIAADDDRLVVVHSFSKSFLMTGWRLGWMVVPATHLDAVGKLIEFNTSCAPVFVQRGGLAGLRDAASTVPALAARMRNCRDRLVGGLQRVSGVEVASPRGGMYAFFCVPGASDDSLAFAKHLVTAHGLGLAPGVAFGDEAQGWLRWCFASRDPQRLDEGLTRLRRALRL